MLKAVTVTLILDVSDPGEALDAMNEILREEQRSWSPGSCLLDYGIGPAPAVRDVDLDPATYSEGDAFGEDGGLRYASGDYLCRACRRPEADCSVTPCAAVIADREARS